jgi:O-antigen/teichoic acid export membrane protein
MATHIRVLQNVFSQFLGKVLTVMAAFFVVKIVSGFGTEFYGNYVTAYEFLAFFGVLADAGLFAVAVREMSSQDGGLPAQKKQHTAFVLGNVLSIRLILILFFTLLAFGVAQLITPYAEMVRWGIGLTGVSMALTIVAGTLSSVLQARYKIHFFSGSLVFGKILLAVLIYILSTSFFVFENDSTRFFAFLGAGIFSNAVFCGLVYYFARRETEIRLRFDREYWNKIFFQALPYGLALVLQTLYLRVDQILISILLGAHAIGIYGLSARILESFLVLGVFFGQSILPKLSAEEGEIEKSRFTLSWGMMKLLIFALPILWGVWLFSPQIVLLLSSEEFLSTSEMVGSDSVLLVLVLTVFFAFFNQLFSFALVSKNQSAFLLITNGLGLFLNVVLNFIFLPIYGVLAAAWSTVLCEVIIFALLIWKVFDSIGFSLDRIFLFRVLGINLVLCGIIFLTSLRENLILSLAFGSLIYGGFLWKYREKIVGTS